MGKHPFKKIALLACVLLLAFIMGCEPVGGMNVNEMILKQLDVSKKEQSQLIELEIDFSDRLTSDEDAEIAKVVKWFERSSLQITLSKFDDLGNVWIEGVLSFAKGSIPFKLHADSKAVRFDIDGVSRPLIIETHYLTDFPLPIVSPESLNENSQREVLVSVRQLVRKVAEYFVKALPNPPVIRAERVSDSINGVPTSLTKLHAELNGEQLGELLLVYLDRLVQDKEGFRHMLREIVLWRMELPPDIQDIFGGAEAFEEEMHVDEIVDDGMATLWPWLESLQKEAVEHHGSEDWKEIFDKGITFSVNLYVDDSLYLRKSAMELKIAPAAFAQYDSPFRQITIRSSGEMWNINGDVQVPAVEVPTNALTEQQMDKMQPFQFLKIIDKSSVIYDILKNELQVDDQSFSLSSEWGVPFYKDKKGVAYVPVRATMREFGVSLQTPARKGEIRFYDEATAQNFVLLIGSKKAFVNGKTTMLTHKVVTDQQFAYVAADDLFRLLRAEYKVSKQYDGELRMKVTRDL